MDSSNGFFDFISKIASFPFSSTLEWGSFKVKGEVQTRKDL